MSTLLRCLLFRRYIFDNDYRFSLLQRSFVKEDGSSLTREEMLTVLSKVQNLQIRASHDVNIATSYLYSVKMDAAVKNGDDLIFGLEECLCPLEYAGPSCQECGPGHTRQEDGSCKKCECSGKSDRCDPENGSCSNCTGNTMGKFQDQKLFNFNKNVYIFFANNLNRFVIKKRSFEI